MKRMAVEMAPWNKLQTKVKRRMAGDSISCSGNSSDSDYEDHPETELPPPPPRKLSRSDSGAQEMKHGDTELRSRSSSHGREEAKGNDSDDDETAEFEKWYQKQSPIRQRLNELIENYNKDEADQNKAEKKLLDKLIKKANINPQDARAQDELVEYVVNNNY